MSSTIVEHQKPLGQGILWLSAIVKGASPEPSSSVREPVPDSSSKYLSRVVAAKGHQYPTSQGVHSTEPSLYE